MALSGLCRRLASLSMRPAISATNTSAFHQSASLKVKEIPYLYEGVKLQKPRKKGKQPPKPTDGRPQLKGVVLKTLIKKPKKPNSANRKCVRVKLSTGREAVAYIPGVGHNLQEHHIVMVEVGKVKDLPGVKLKCVRGKYDLQHVKK